MSADHSTLLDTAERGALIDAPIVTGASDEWQIVTTPPLNLIDAIVVQARTAAGCYTFSSVIEGDPFTAANFPRLQADGGMATIYSSPYEEGQAPTRTTTFAVGPGSSGGVVISYLRR